MSLFRATETVKCGDREFTLAIDIEIIDALEDDLGVGFDKILDETIGKGRVGKTTRLLHGLLLRHHPDIELDDVGSLVVQHGIEIGEALIRLIEKAIPEPEEEKGPNPPKAHRGTGESSSSRGARQTSRQTNSGSRRPALSS